MITENQKKGTNKQTKKGLGNEVPQNSNKNQGYGSEETEKKPQDTDEKPVDVGGVEPMKYDPQLEEQWLAVRDEYRAHYPGLEDVDTEYKKGSFHVMINRLSKRRKRTTEQIQDEIMKWSSPE